jgi:heterodisulfide reductase subunit A
LCPEGTIDLDEQASEETINVGTIIVATGGRVYDAKNKSELGFGKYPNVINNLQLQRLTDKLGPTTGIILRPSDNKIPQKIAFIQCVGARDPDIGNPWCSRYCCQAMLGQVKYITEEYPNTQIFVFHKDIRAFNKLGEELYREVRGTGQVVFVRTPDIKGIEEDTETGNLIVKATDEMLQMPVEAEVDMVVLSTAIIPPENIEEIARLLVIARSPDGFFLELHPKLSPLDTSTDGIYIAGVAQGPKDITYSVAQAKGVASRAAIPMTQGEVELEAYLAVVDPDLCSGCRICEHVCPYNAPEIKEREDGTLYSEVSEALCKGCGVCVAACPSGAITMLHFKDDQIMSEIEALLTG